MSSTNRSEPNTEGISRENILGVLISTINMQTAVEFVKDSIDRSTHQYVCVTPAHGVMECQAHPDLRQIFNSSGLTTPDGMGVVWLLRLMGHKHVSRVYGPDLLLAVCEKSLETGWRHFFYGGAPGIPEKLAEELCARFPGLQVAGLYSPPYRRLTAEEDQDVIDMINESGADIVWVGISTPKQERWMAQHVGKLDAPVLIGVGAAFDFLSGAKRQAPKWIQRSGLEWLFRLATEPRRLWKRYIQYPYFGVLVLGQLLGLKKYPD
jgi:N-acetylglucosaminyldiphosphoundecaprenol N-acetyl-beta-D-mannosaminyltransferase